MSPDADFDRTWSEERAAGNQNLADNDQTASEVDQIAADSDQTAADDDQIASATDQAASDHDLLLGGDPSVHSFTRDIRDRSAQQRRQSALHRVSAAAERDDTALARDREAAARDRAAELLDSEIAKRDIAAAMDGRTTTGAELLARASQDRKRAAADRLAAAEARARAASDRQRAAADREHAARDRLQARSDRDALLAQLAIMETDQLTGARTRPAGLAEIDREIARTRRATGRLAVAYIDVVGLKAINDRHGHAAGDAVLQRAVTGIRGDLRSYDLIVRVGGDEFVCAMPGATIEDARERFMAIQTALEFVADHCAIRAGFAELMPGDDTDRLIARADAALRPGPPRS